MHKTNVASDYFMHHAGCCKDGLREAVSKETTVILLLEATSKLPTRVLKAQLNGMIRVNRFIALHISQSVFYAFL